MMMSFPAKTILFFLFFSFYFLSRGFQSDRQRERNEERQRVREPPVWTCIWSDSWEVPVAGTSRKYSLIYHSKLNPEQSTLLLSQSDLDKNAHYSFFKAAAKKLPKKRTSSRDQETFDRLRYRLSFFSLILNSHELVLFSLSSLYLVYMLCFVYPELALHFRATPRRPSHCCCFLAAIPMQCRPSSSGEKTVSLLLFFFSVHGFQVNQQDIIVISRKNRILRTLQAKLYGK